MQATSLAPLETPILPPPSSPAFALITALNRGEIEPIEAFDIAAQLDLADPPSKPLSELDKSKAARLIAEIEQAIEDGIVKEDKTIADAASVNIATLRSWIRRGLAGEGNSLQIALAHAYTRARARMLNAYQRKFEEGATARDRLNMLAATYPERYWPNRIGKAPQTTVNVMNVTQAYGVLKAAVLESRLERKTNSEISVNEGQTLEDANPYDG